MTLRLKKADGCTTKFLNHTNQELKTDFSFRFITNERMRKLRTRMTRIKRIKADFLHNRPCESRYKNQTGQNDGTDFHF